MEEHYSIREYNSHKLATVFHDAGAKKVVVFCHGYRSSSIGPSRLFVSAARRLAVSGISSLRFDQYGSGNSEGDFFDSRFNDWVGSTTAIARDFMEQGYEVALFGQSMGGSTVINAAAALPGLQAAVAWVPDATVGPFTQRDAPFIEEAGQRVKPIYWEEAHDAHTADKLREAQCPMYIVQCSEDAYVSAANHRAIENAAMPQHQVEMFKGLPHSGWTYEQGEAILAKSIGFLQRQFQALPDVPASD